VALIATAMTVESITWMAPRLSATTISQPAIAVKIGQQRQTKLARTHRAREFPVTLAFFIETID